MARLLSLRATEKSQKKEEIAGMPRNKRASYLVSTFTFCLFPNHYQFP
jgi:hypothetical protein